MKRGTLLLALVFMLLAGYILRFEKQSPNPGLPRKKIFDFEPESVKSIEISRLNTKLIIRKIRGHRWEMISPLADWADSDACESFAESASILTAGSSVSRAEGASAYGLDQTAAKVLFSTAPGRSAEIRVGKESPTHEGYYAFLPSTGKISLIPENFGALVSKTADQWRDRAIMHFDPERVTKITLVSKKKTLVFAREKQNWRILFPIQARADSHKISQLLSTLSGARLARFGGGKISHPALTFSIWEKGSKKPEQIIVGEKVKDGYLAENPDRSASFILAADSVREFSHLK